MSGITTRKIIRIDEEKCDGCGQCAEACHEGAIRIIDGKAKLVSDSYCDGLGACIGQCPRGALTIEEREAAPFDEAAALAQAGRPKKPEAAPKSPAAVSLGCGCPGSAVRDLRQSQSSGTLQNRPSEPMESRLSNWPVQLRLVPENAPYLKGADLLIAADCTAFAHPDFHRTFLSGPNTVCLVGCPKLDDAQQYVDKIARMIERNEPASLTLVRMEVPCCGGMTRILEEAIRRVGRDASLRIVTVGVRGDILDRETKTWVFGTNA